MDLFYWCRDCTDRCCIYGCNKKPKNPPENAVVSEPHAVFKAVFKKNSQGVNNSIQPQPFWWVYRHFSAYIHGHVLEYDDVRDGGKWNRYQLPFLK